MGGGGGGDGTVSHRPALFSSVVAVYLYIDGEFSNLLKLVVLRAILTMNSVAHR
jgi:hypothetical protein